MNWLKSLRSLNIRSRMLLAALLPLALISTLLAGVFLSGRFDEIQASYEQRNRSVVRQVALASEFGLFSANRVQLQALAAGALLESDVRWVAILDGRGQLLASAGERHPELVIALNLIEGQGFVSDRRLDWLAQPVYPSAVQLDDLFEKNAPDTGPQPRQLGQVLMLFSRQAVDARKSRMLLTGAVMGLLSLLFGMALAAYLSRGVIGPILRITRLVERVGRGDFAAVDQLREQDFDHDPLRDLQNNIFVMAQRLAAARDELEQQVSLATQALREKKDEAEQANLAKSRFLAAASHDLRQPTHALGLFVARLAQLPGDGQTQALIGNLDASVRAMQNLLDGLLDISRLEARAVQVNKRPFALSSLFVQLTQDLGPVADEKGLRLRVRPTELWVLSDTTLVYRILLNLVGNALRYTEHGGVLVAARRQAGTKQVLIQVWDSGIGIAPEDQQAVFAEFYQVDNAARDRTKGLGLGLNIVQRTADLLGHPLALVSQPGQGTRFTLSLPWSVFQRDLPEEPTKDKSLPDDLADQCVLVIEDDALARSALVGLLGSWGMQVLQAKNPGEAYACLSRGVIPAVIVSDFRLQAGLNGVELVQGLRQYLGYLAPACVMSGDSDPALIQAVQEAGLTLLYKPVRPAKLRNLLRHLVLDQRRVGPALS